MASVNKVILIGNLGKDPEVRTTPQGTTLARFSVATTTAWKDASGAKQERTEWHDIVAVGEARADLRRVSPEGETGLRRGQPPDAKLGGPERTEEVQDGGQGLQRRDARAPGDGRPRRRRPGGGGQLRSRRRPEPAPTTTTCLSSRAGAGLPTSSPRSRSRTRTATRSTRSSRRLPSRPTAGGMSPAGAAPRSSRARWSPKRLVIVEFPSLARAQEWWDSPEYAAGKALRRAAPGRRCSSWACRHRAQPPEAPPRMTAIRNRESSATRPATETGSAGVRAAERREVRSVGLQASGRLEAPGLRHQALRRPRRTPDTSRSGGRRTGGRIRPPRRARNARGALRRRRARPSRGRRKSRSREAAGGSAGARSPPLPTATRESRRAPAACEIMIAPRVCHEGARRAPRSIATSRGVRLEHRQRLVRVELRAAEPREMLEASADSGRDGGPRETRAAARSMAAGSIRSGALSQNQSARGGQAAVDHRSEVHVEAETAERSPRRDLPPSAPARAARHAAARAPAPARPGGDRRVRPPGREREIAAPASRSSASRASSCRERLDVAAEQDDAVRRMGGENVPFGVREPGPGDSDPEEPRAHFPLSRCCSAARRDSDATGVIWSRSTARSFSSASSSSAEKRRN